MARARRPRRRPAAASCSPWAFRAVVLARARRSACFALASSRSASVAAVSARSASSEGCAPDRRQGLVTSGGAARPQLETDRVRTPARRTGPVPHRGTSRSTGGLDPLARDRDPPDCLGQQTGVGWVGHVAGHHRRVGPQRGGAQHLGLGRLGQQRLVQPVHRRRATAGGQLHQRRRVRHRPVQGNPAEPPPGDRVAHLATQALVAESVAEPRGTSTAGRSPSASTDDRFAGRSTERTVRRTPDHPATRRSEPARQGAGATPAAAPTRTTTVDRLRYGTRSPRSLLAQGVEAILPFQDWLITHRRS